MEFNVYRFSGVMTALQTSSAPTELDYRTLAADATRFVSANIFFAPAWGANYLSIASPAEFDAYTGVEEISATVSWGKQQGFGGYMTFTVNQEYMGSLTGDAQYPLSTALFNDVNGVGGVGTSGPAAIRGPVTKQ
jgi:hypothetical protein